MLGARVLVVVVAAATSAAAIDFQLICDGCALDDEDTRGCAPATARAASRAFCASTVGGSFRM